MKNKYGEYKDSQISEYKKRLHVLVHWILKYKDSGDETTLNNYFDIVQFKLMGVNALFNYPPELIEIMSLIESAKQENMKKENFNSKLFRSAILDAHSLIDKLGGD